MLLVRGDVTRFELADGTQIDVPQDWGLVHDPLHTVIDPCTLFVCPVRTRTHGAITIRKRIAKVAEEYFGGLEDLVAVDVDLPRGPWNPLGQVTTIFYARYGNQQGRYHHPFRDSAVLSRNVAGTGLRLKLPRGCVIDEHGFVWP